MNETLHRIHNVDIDAVGLGDFGKRGKLCGPLQSSAVYLESARGYVKTLAGSQSGVRTPDLKHVKETGTPPPPPPPPPPARGTPLLGLNRYEPLKGVQEAWS